MQMKQGVDVTELRDHSYAKEMSVWNQGSYIDGSEVDVAIKDLAKEKAEG